MNIKSDIAKKILLAAAGSPFLGEFSIISDTNTALEYFGRWYQNQDRRNRYRIRKIFSKLRTAKLIEFSEEGGGIKIALTETGKKAILQCQLEDLKIKQQKKWDKKWRMVILSIPENFKKERNLLRNKLKAFGFHPFQKSIWVYPYECKNEIYSIGEFFGIGQHIKLAEVNFLDGEESLKEKFGL